MIFSNVHFYELNESQFYFLKTDVLVQKNILTNIPEAVP